MAEVFMFACHIGPADQVSVDDSAKTILAARAVPDVPVHIALSGYDDDPRHLWDIPEACHYVRLVFIAVYSADPVWWSGVQSRLHKDTRVWILLCLGGARVVPGGVEFMHPGQTQ